MILQFVADVHISPITVSSLQEAGYQIRRVTDFIPANSSDKQIVELAIQKASVIVTQDLDFSAIIAQSGMIKPSVISLRVGNAKPQTIAVILKTILPLIEKDLISGSIVSVEETEFRVRKLPIIRG
jgi:predicted nuclease of predicted toxin-antitoxin system